MKRLLFTLAVAAVAAFAQPAQAGPCITGPLFSGHKVIHLVGTAAVASAVTFATDSPGWGFASGMGVGLAREVWKATHPGYACEVSSIAYDLAGASLGAYATQRWVLLPKKGGAVVAYVGRF